ncbi:MAG TPA: FAD-dependent oxidoreductase [Candidatus Saccharimonadales bacterium]|nr:FAD-dependent oxidoreductase [Candidatus Saccharimonadales bacterium]
MKPADIVVIGGGVVGLSVAFHLARSRAGSVLVLERDKFLGTGSTGKCAGGIRQQFASAPNVILSRESVKFLERFEEETGVTCDFFQNGYLFLLSGEEQLAHFRGNVELQRSLGVDSRLITPQEVLEIVPQVSLEGVVGATFCPTDGLASPHEMTQGFAKAARDHGAQILAEVEATGLEVRAGRVCGVRTAQGDIPTRAVVNAAGPYARQVAAWAGVDLPVQPVRRHVFTTRPLDFLTVRFPMVVDMLSGVYMHQESGGMLMGLADKREPYGFNEDVDWNFMPVVVEAAMQRIPALEEAEILTGWAGLYEDTPDHNAVLGPVAGVEGLFLANGFSGHGLMHAPAAGRVVADAVLGRPLPPELAALGFERFARGGLEPEAEVI